MSCNTKTSVEADFSSVASTIASIEIATPLAYSYPESLPVALEELKDSTIVIPAVRYGIDNLTHSINYFYDTAVNGTTPESADYRDTIRNNYPSLDDRIDQSTKISYTELADFLDFISYPDTKTFNNYVDTTPQRVIRDLDNYYGDKMSGESVSLCSLLENPFAKVAAVVDNITSLASGILDMIPSIAARLKSFAEMIKGVVDKVFETMKGVVNNLAGTVASVAQGISNLPSVVSGLASQFSQKYAALNNMFSEMSLKNIKDGIDKFVTKAVKQFEKILENPEVVLHLLYMFCKTASFVESALKNPVQAFQSMIGNVQHEHNLLKVKSASRTQGAMFGGRAVATEESIARVRNERTTSHNSAVGAAVTSNNQQPGDATQFIVPHSNLVHPDPNSWSNLNFVWQVINNSFWVEDRTITMDDGGRFHVPSMNIAKDIGYRGCKLEVLEMMNHVGSILGVKLTINSAFRHPVYNQWKRQTSSGVAKYSQHMKGVALDVSMRNGVNRQQFISVCKRVGFTWHKEYPTFIHMDTRGR